MWAKSRRNLLYSLGIEPVVKQRQYLFSAVFSFGNRENVGGPWGDSSCFPVRQIVLNDVALAVRLARTADAKASIPVKRLLAAHRPVVDFRHKS